MFNDNRISTGRFNSFISPTNKTRFFLALAGIFCSKYISTETLENYYVNWKQASPFYAGNRIQTTKYTWFTFLPKNLFEQFHRLGNLYFFFLAVLNWFPQVEVFHREITMMPLIVVLLASMIKDAVEDYRKYQFDKMINSSKTRVYDK
uniref:P-type ATPase N-terminal domain-containing protein n=1 Tax=Strigops habroptila TaxID=2489341 RepID=A0A672V1H0_STRHB